MLKEGGLIVIPPTWAPMPPDSCHPACRRRSRARQSLVTQPAGGGGGGGGATIIEVLVVEQEEVSEPAANFVCKSASHLEQKRYKKYKIRNCLISQTSRFFSSRSPPPPPRRRRSPSPPYHFTRDLQLRSLAQDRRRP